MLIPLRLFLRRGARLTFCFFGVVRMDTNHTIITAVVVATLGAGLAFNTIDTFGLSVCDIDGQTMSKAFKDVATAIEANCDTLRMKRYKPQGGTEIVSVNTKQIHAAINQMTAAYEKTFDNAFGVSSELTKQTLEIQKELLRQNEDFIRLMQRSR